MAVICGIDYLAQMLLILDWAAGMRVLLVFCLPVDRQVAVVKQWRQKVPKNDYLLIYL